MSRLVLGLTTVAIAATTACSALGRQAFQQPVVQLKDVAVQGLGLTGGQLAVKLNVFNPNGFRLDATRLSYAVNVGENNSNATSLANGTLDSRFTVQSGESTTVTIPVSFTYLGIGAAGRQLLNTGGVPYHVTGDVTVGTIIGNFTVPYSSTGRFTAFGGTSRQ